MNASVNANDETKTNAKTNAKTTPTTKPYKLCRHRDQCKYPANAEANAETIVVFIVQLTLGSL